MATSQTTEMQVEGEVSVEEAVKEMLEIEVEEDEGDPFEGMNNAQVAEIYHKMKPETSTYLDSSNDSTRSTTKPTDTTLPAIN